MNAPPGPFTAIAVGGHQSVCALTERSEVACWNWKEEAATIVSPDRYLAIDAAMGTTCAVTDTGDVACWGADESAADAPPGRYTAISTTEGYTCGLTEDSEVVCWGSRSKRAYEARAADAEPGAPTVLIGAVPDPPPDRYLAVTVGSSPFEALLVACAVRESGGFTCWRSNLHGYDEEEQTWREEAGAEESLAAGDFCLVHDLDFPLCPANSGYVAVSQGGDHTCAILGEGRSECWPSGFGAQAFGTLRVMTPPDPSPERYLSISTDGDYACALTEAGDPVCWESVRNVIPLPDPPPGRYMAVSDGRSHTCALTEAGEAVCWGWNNWGQTEVPPGRYTAISASAFHTCALTEARVAVCWGRSAFLPRGHYTAISTGSYAYGGTTCALREEGEPVCGRRTLPDPELPQGRYIAIDASGERQVCGLREAGEVVCWSDYYDEPRTSSGPYTALSAGGDVCALTEDGEVACWGREDSPSGSYTALAVGWQHACALTGDGEAVCWAWASQKYTDEEPYESPYHYELTQPPTGPFLAISSSEFRSCAVTEAGEVVCWGDVEYWEMPRWVSLN